MAAKNRHNAIDCMDAALPDEEYFVLLARDPAMPALLGIWASLRVGNAAAAMDNFTLLMAPDLVKHYQAHPDIAKSQEAVDTANRAADWRQANLEGPDGRPTWKQSLVRPKMIDVTPSCTHPDEITQHTGDGRPVLFCPDCGTNRLDPAYRPSDLGRGQEP